MTPDKLEKTAARYDRSYGCKPGDGGTSDQLRAGAEAMRRVGVLERGAEADETALRIANAHLTSLAKSRDIAWQRAESAEAKLAALQENGK